MGKSQVDKNRRGKMRIARDTLQGWVQANSTKALSADLLAARDYSGLTIQDAELRLWLPEAAKVALTEVCDRLGTSYTVYLTEFFAIYLYGVHEVLKMRELMCGLYKQDETPEEASSQDRNPLFNVEEDGIEDDDPEPALGKSIFSLKIFLPSKIKVGLQARANKARVPLVRFVRAMICAHLFGRDVGPRMLLLSDNGSASP